MPALIWRKGRKGVGEKEKGVGDKLKSFSVVTDPIFFGFWRVASQ